MAVELTGIAVQIHGGMGFVEETGVAQHYRDARITTIYEGTNGIQAIDLVGRNLKRRARLEHPHDRVQQVFAHGNRQRRERTENLHGCGGDTHLFVRLTERGLGGCLPRVHPATWQRHLPAVLPQRRPALGQREEPVTSVGIQRDEPSRRAELFARQVCFSTDPPSRRHPPLRLMPREGTSEDAPKSFRQLIHSTIVTGLRGHRLHAERVSY